MIANICDCKENCFSYVKMGIKIINNKQYYEKIKISKCNRLLIENIRKKPCGFYEEKVISTNKINKTPEDKKEDKTEDKTEYKIGKESDKKYTDKSKKVTKKVPKKKIITVESIKKEISKKLELYEYSGTNYYANINKFLLLIGYKAHIPSLETLEDLKIRIKKPPSNPNILYGFRKELFLSISIGDLSEEYEIDKDIYEKIYENKTKEDPFLIYKENFIQNILKPKSKLKKNKNRTKKILQYTFSHSKQNEIDDNINKIANLDNEDNLEEQNKNDRDNNTEEESDDDESGDDKSTNEDKEFDMEKFSDGEDQLENDEYDDFSD